MFKTTDNVSACIGSGPEQGPVCGWYMFLLLASKPTEGQGSLKQLPTHAHTHTHTVLVTKVLGHLGGSSRVAIGQRSFNEVVGIASRVPKSWAQRGSRVRRISITETMVQC